MNQMLGFLQGVSGFCDARIISIAGPSPRKGTSHGTSDFFRTTEIDGLSIFYREAGPKDGPTLLLLHGHLFYDYRTNIDAYPKWQAWMREKQPRLLVLWGKYDLSFELSEPEAYRRDVPRPAMERAGIERKVRSHGFDLVRHSAASIVHTLTGDLKLAQELLGHATIATTTDIYTHLLDEAKAGAATEFVGE